MHKTETVMLDTIWKQ